MIVRCINGKVRAVCSQCGARSAPVPPSTRDEASLLGIGAGWSVAPLLGGDAYTCPVCVSRRHSG